MMIPPPNTVGLFNYTAPDFRHTTVPSFKLDEIINQSTCNGNPACNGGCAT